MEKGLKKAIPAVIVAVLCLVFYIVLGNFKPEVKEEVLFPKSGLSDSIFDYQNMTYSPSDGLESKYLFTNLPFSVDLPNEKRASVGEATVVEKNGFYFLVSEVDKEADIRNILGNGYTHIIDVNGDVLSTLVTELNKDSGYINGSVAEYGVYEISVGEKKMYVTAMRLLVSPNIYETDKQIVVACMGANYSTTGLANLQALTHAVVNTMTIDKNHLKELTNE